MSRNPLVIDLAVAILCALVVLIISPGVAVDAIVAAIVLVVCGVSFALSRRRRRPIRGYGVGQDGPRRPRRPRP